MLVLDNLPPHTPGTLYEVFLLAAAKRPTDKLELHYTPPPGSGLNIAEMELRGLSRQGLGRRVPAEATLPAEGAAGEDRRQTAGGKVAWRFTTKDARIKLKRLYPSIRA